ncbi:hypothetical protein B0H11DRAFT_480323 [Mycena galericulata]|nr:hypothetical protein B0H11DRAFT_480323 [Mycena galericulata]
MSEEDRKIITSFKESNPTMGVKKIVDSLKTQIPAINAKMVRSIPGPLHESVAAEQTDTSNVPEPRKKSRAERRAIASGKPKSKDTDDNDTRPSRSGDAMYPQSPALENLLQMYAKAQEEGREYQGWYPLLINGNTEYNYEELLWVNVKQGDETQAIMFERMKLESMLGHKEAVWMLWKMLKSARSDTQGGEVQVTDLAIAQQLNAEFGTDPLDVEQAMQLESGTMNASSMRLATLLSSMAS